MDFKTVSGAYGVIMIHDGVGCHISEHIYHEACQFMLEHFRRKYGKDSFWFREMFEQINSDNEHESRFRIRCLVHARSLGCMHETVAKCDEYKNSIEEKWLVEKQCQHCSYVEGIKEKWEEKDEQIKQEKKT